MKAIISTLLVSAALSTPALADDYSDYIFSALDANKDGELSLPVYLTVP